MAHAHADADYSKERVYQFDIGSGLSWFRADPIGQALHFKVGVRRNMIVVPSKAAQRLAATVRSIKKQRPNSVFTFSSVWLSHWSQSSSLVPDKPSRFW